MGLCVTLDCSTWKSWVGWRGVFCNCSMSNGKLYLAQVYFEKPNIKYFVGIRLYERPLVCRGNPWHIHRFGSEPWPKLINVVCDIVSVISFFFCTWICNENHLLIDRCCCPYARCIMSVCMYIFEWCLWLTPLPWQRGIRVHTTLWHRYAFDWFFTLS